MDVNNTQQQEEALRAEVARVRARLQEAGDVLDRVEGELEGLAPRRQQYELLDQACGSLERLGELGVADLFWGQRRPPVDVEAHLREVRGRVSVFQAQLAEIDSRRRSALDAIAAHETELEILGDDLYHAQQQEERRKLEWVVEREISPVPRRAQAMAWARGGEDDRRFRRSLAAALALSLLLGALLPMIDLPLPEPFRVDAVPPRLVELVRQEQAKPVPPPRKVEEAKPKEPELEKQKPDQSKPEEPEQKLAQQPKDSPRKQDQPATAAVRPDPQKTPEKAGILAFKEKFASLADDKVTPRLGRDARFTDVGDAAGEPTTRSMLTTNAPGSSGGINLASLSRNAGRGGGTGAGGGGGGAGGLHGVQVGRMTSSIGGGGGGGGDGTGAGGDRPRAGSGAGLSRTDEEIQIVFDRYKAALYRLYNRELRKDPTLRGQMVLRLTIEPDGSVSMCALQASDMNAPDLTAQVVDRVRTINFGAKDGVQALTIVYPIDFLPAA
ncbi:MAG TPA: AgmX/PglI C-terminal domain-containing protein [Steroidobacteraceae bacterium]|nr:AgmX/PglI C-terminal domain-containing protein [Steroidobacteraceae bacterium]